MTTDIAPISLTIASKKNSKPNRRTKVRLAAKDPMVFTVASLAHDGRGVGVYGDHSSHEPEKAGKKVLLNFALPNETVLAKITASKKYHEEGDAVAVLDGHNDQRVTPVCRHFGVCGGCSLQHLDPAGQIAFKQQVLAELLQHHAGIAPKRWLAPLVGDRLGYRTKARMGVRYVAKKQTALVGFRERGSNFLADLDSCAVLDKRLGGEIAALKALITQLDGRNHIAQLELAMGEQLAHIADSQKAVAVIVRHLAPLSQKDRQLLQAFFAHRQWQLYLQPHGADSVQRIDDPSGRAASLTVPPTGGLFYHVPPFDLTYEFSPQDFTQVNLSVNRQMLVLACELLDLKAGERVLDLFCGLGNFSLALAKMVGETGFVVGVEGSSQMTQRAQMNAAANGLNHTAFYTKDLTQDLSGEAWAMGDGQFDALLIDPPRSGAQEVMAYLPKFNASRILYVSCNPITLARDSKALIDAGYQLACAGVMDMFCHTGHVESLALFKQAAY